MSALLNALNSAMGSASPTPTPRIAARRFGEIVSRFTEDAVELFKELAREAAAS